MNNLSQDDQAWFKAMEKEYINPICPNQHCKHPYSAHVLKNNSNRTCTHNETVIVVVNALHRERESNCGCDLTQREILLNLQLQAKASIAQEERKKAIHNSPGTFSETPPNVYDDGGYGYKHNGDYGTSWGV